MGVWAGALRAAIFWEESNDATAGSHHSTRRRSERSNPPELHLHLEAGRLQEHGSTRIDTKVLEQDRPSGSQVVQDNHHGLWRSAAEPLHPDLYDRRNTGQV